MNRKLLLAIPFLILAGGIHLKAYITNLTPAGASVRWFLTTLSPFAPKNSINRSTRSIRYYLQADGFSEENRTRELNAVRSAFQQWESIPGTTIQFEEAGLISETIDINNNDATNVVFWAKTSTLVNGETADIRGRLAVTFRSGLVDIPVIVEADIVMNGIDKQWFTDFTAVDDNRQFVEGVALHEIGHWLGAAHTPIGAASMNFDSGDGGVRAVVGLSPDDVAFADQAYATAPTLATRGTLSGVITKDGTPVYGASIVLEDSTGSIVTGGISRQESQVGGPDGHYLIEGVPTGDYHLRVLPIQPNTASSWITIPGIIPLPNGEEVDTSFLPSTGIPVTIYAGQTSVLDVEVEAGNVPFTVTGIRLPTTNGFRFTLVRAGVTLPPGARDLVVGVYGEELPAEGATLSITGPGVTISPTESRSDLFEPLVHLYALVSVDQDAPPGLRSFIVRHGDKVAYAPGFVEILPPTLDYNFDGLDDRYQRRFFDPFTGPDAGPESDPDGDGFTNAEEASLEADPTDATSIPIIPINVDPFEILSISLTEKGAEVTFVSVPEAEYQLFTRRQVNVGVWERVGLAVKAEGETTTVVDPSAKESIEFYRVESLP